jgi:17beta-estradiol 17-dehydrogenase / very-long-chain 3-oxoacyl-CoA reductase
MVECNSVAAFAAVGAIFLGYKVFTLLKTLFDVFVVPGISVKMTYYACKSFL